MKLILVSSVEEAYHMVTNASVTAPGASLGPVTLEIALHHERTDEIKSQNLEDPV